MMAYLFDTLALVLIVGIVMAYAVSSSDHPSSGNPWWMADDDPIGSDIPHDNRRPR